MYFNSTIPNKNSKYNGIGGNKLNVMETTQHIKKILCWQTKENESFQLKSDNKQ